MHKQRFPYSTSDNPLGNLPFLPITLFSRGCSCSVSALVDTGASVNVLPYDLGLQLGALWERQPKSVELVGNLANYEARGLLVYGQVGHFDPVELVFAWTRTRDVPVILGQMNFFLEFDVCFFGSQGYIEVMLHQP